MIDERDALKALLETLRQQIDDEALDRRDLAYLQSARSVIGLWRQWWNPDQGCSVAHRDELKFRMVYPIAQHALNNVAIGLDMSAALPGVAAGLPRTAFEHALTAQCVLLTHDGEHQLLLELQNEGHKRAHEFHKGLGSSTPR